ncbi:hypothetical protein [Anatilimnocola floriformis]|uniref:hypothetical protein n=1 Tax=Anatilimnocola floriformis TaxID=2948575 RepID=UPI0020C39D45|nr:hypothetical protein [Anatilimnocola floriformis]
MTRQWIGIAFAMILGLTVTSAFGQARGKPGGGGGERPGGAGGERSEPGRSEPSRSEPGRSGPGNTSGRSEGRPEGNKPEGNNPAARPGSSKPPGGAWGESKQQSNNGHKAAGAEEYNNKNSKPSGAEGAAAGATAANRNQPNASGAEGAAAGAAAANRNQPNYSGAQGAAAGAAAANRNQPQYSGAEGAAAGAAAANRNQPQYSGAEGAVAGATYANRNQPQYGAAAGYAAVRNSFDRPDMYSPAWHTTHVDAWAPAAWAAGSAWTPAAWGAIATHCNYTNRPVSYDYGNNVNYVNGNIMIDGQSAGTAEDFSQQASDLAAAGTAAAVGPNDKWLPLGVFAMVKNDQQHPQLILQLAVNQTGVVRGNYTDEVSDRSYPIHGGVDKNTQRISWTVGGNTTNVMEAGLGNLSQGEAPALLHKNGKTERWILVRLQQPQ